MTKYNLEEVTHLRNIVCFLKEKKEEETKKDKIPIGGFVLQGTWEMQLWYNQKLAKELWKQAYKSDKPPSGRGALIKSATWEHFELFPF